MSCNGVDFKCFYLDLDYCFSDVWLVYFIIDINWVCDSLFIDLWLKYVYL